MTNQRLHIADVCVGYDYVCTVSMTVSLIYYDVQMGHFRLRNIDFRIQILKFRKIKSTDIYPQLSSPRIKSRHNVSGATPAPVPQLSSFHFKSSETSLLVKRRYFRNFAPSSFKASESSEMKNQHQCIRSYRHRVQVFPQFFVAVPIQSSRFLN
jgi:hypothetical protein